MRRKAIALVLVLFFALASCGTWQMAKENPYHTWSSKKKLTNAVNVYVTEYDKYMAAVIRPDLTEAQKAYLRNKRAALVGLDTAIVLLIPIADAGGVIPPDLEAQLLDFMTQLGFQPM